MQNETKLDIIREVINIGIGEAAASLSDLLQSKILLNVPSVSLIPIEKMNENLMAESASLGVYISQAFMGEIEGKTILFYTKECSVALLKIIDGHAGTTDSISESGIATLNEIGNIIMVSCLSGIGNMTKARIDFSLPRVTVEISEKYFSNLLLEMERFNQVILIKNEMIIKDFNIKGYLFILLSFRDFEKVIGSLMREQS